MRGRRGWLESAWVEARRRRYAEDPALFFSECVFVEDGLSDEGRSTFDLFPYQEEGLETLLGERFLMVLKARQLGWTTLVMATALWELLFKPSSNILLVSKDQDTANGALSTLDFMWRFIPDWLKPSLPKLETDSAREHVWRWESGLTSRIVSRPATDSAGVGETTTWVIWDEAAQARQQSETARAVKPTTDVFEGRMTVFSTARGAHDWFANMWRLSREGDTEYATIFHPWYVSPFLNPLWEKVAGCPRGRCEDCIDWSRYEEKKAEFEDEPWLIHSEYPTTEREAFRRSGNPRFPDLPDVEAFGDWSWRGRVDPTLRVFMDEDGGPLHVNVREAPAGADVIVSVDGATGNGGDFTVAHVMWLDAEGLPFVGAMWRSNQIEPMEAVKSIEALGFMYGDRPAKIVIEKAGGFGDTFIHGLRDAGYPNMYVHRYKGHRKRRSDTTYGFPMTPGKKELVVDTLATHLPRRSRDNELAMGGLTADHHRELSAFVRREDGKIAADTGMHDDIVMSLAIGTLVATDRGRLPSGAGPTSAPPEPGKATFSVSDIFDRAKKARRREKHDFLERHRRQISSAHRNRRVRHRR